MSFFISHSGKNPDYAEHRRLCLRGEIGGFPRLTDNTAQRIELDAQCRLEFKAYYSLVPMEWSLYFDTETLPCSPDKHHQIVTWCVIVVHKDRMVDVAHASGLGSMRKFWRFIHAWCDILKAYYAQDHAMPSYIPPLEDLLNEDSKCWLCNKNFADDDNFVFSKRRRMFVSKYDSSQTMDIARDHSHTSGTYLGLTHAQCE